MQAEQMWKTSTGEGVTVAVLDTGVNPDTPSLKGQLVEDGVPASVGYKATVDYDGHGTTMAETIAGTGAGGGLKGLAPGAEILPIRLDLEQFKNKTEGKKAPTFSEAVRAAADSDAKIINMSFGGTFIFGDDAAAVRYAYSKGKLLFAAVGNAAGEKNRDGENVDFPAGYPYVVGVAAADKSGTAGKFSEHGVRVDIAAPGLALPGWCDATFQRYCSVQGTSSATAVASASAALIWSAHPDWTNNQVLNALIETASRDWPRDETSVYLGHGLVRPRLVLADPAFNPGPPDLDPLLKQHEAQFGGDSAFQPIPSPTPTTPADASSKTPADGAEPAPGGKGEEAGATDTDTAAAQDGDSGALWPIAGAAAAVVVIGGVVAFVVMRKRRTV
ncbi:S8 family serine peptidase [Streptomyces sp. NPDC002734]|uniref:S8 family serine peptidase n=1 Tax=Streptomyces sp. NPDC002734 TaxID=3154426 RepID=UPI003323EF8F